MVMVMVAFHLMSDKFRCDYLPYNKPFTRVNGLL